MKCQICGKSADKLTSICKTCLSRAAGSEQQDQIKNVANVLSLTVSTNTNVKNAMESLCEIAGELGVL